MMAEIRRCTREMVEMRRILNDDGKGDEFAEIRKMRKGDGGNEEDTQ